MHTAQRRVVLGFCPEIFRPELDFLFLTVAAEFFNGFWVRRANPEQLFSPKGDIYVPKELFPDHFHEGEAVAWEVEDQPNYAEKHLSCRYRAIRLVDPPLELVPVPWPSTEPTLRQQLQETGVAVTPRRNDCNVLLEFPDGLLARVRLQPRPGGAGSFVVPAAEFAHPLEAWPPGKPFSVLTLESRRGTRRYCALPVPPTGTTSLDLSTLEEALTAAKRAGGLGSVATAPPMELRRHLERLEEAVNSFDGPAWQARRKRLEHFLEQAQVAVEERGRWETFLTAHPLFRETLEAAITKGREELRQKVRAEILAEEEELQRSLDGLGKEWEELEGVKATTQGEVSKLREELARLKPESVTAIAQAPARDDGSVPQGDARHHAPDNGVGPGQPPKTEKRAGGGSESTGIATRGISLTLATRLDVLSSPPQALALLEKNLQALGIIRVSSRLLAREVLVAASLGQLLLFRGSLAGPVAEAVAVSLAGAEVCVLPVPLGTIEPLPVDFEKEPQIRALLFEGINRSCLDAFGGAIQEQVRSRVLGRTKEQFPVLLGTIAEGPSCLPPGPHLLSFGPMIQTDALSWDLQQDVGTMSPGRCEAGAWRLSETNQGEEEWGELLDELFPLPNLLWERSVRGALRRLAAFPERERPNQPKWSLLFAWVLPRLLASEGDSSALAKHLRDGFLHGVASEDQRVRRLLRAAGMEAEQ